MTVISFCSKEAMVRSYHANIIPSCKFFIYINSSFFCFIAILHSAGNLEVNLELVGLPADKGMI